MPKGDLWVREPGRAYGADFTDRSLRRELVAVVNGWTIRRHTRVFHRNRSPSLEQTEITYHVGTISDVTKPLLLTMRVFTSQAAARSWAESSGSVEAWETRPLRELLNAYDPKRYPLRRSKLR